MRENLGQNKKKPDSKTSEKEAREYAESIINTVREILIVLDQDLRVISASRYFYDAFKVSPEETEGQLIYDLGNKQWDIPKLRHLLETLLPRQTTLDDYEVEHEFADLGRRTMLLNAREVQRKSGKERLILLAIEDITERKRQENLLSESEERYRRLFETANDGILLLEKAEGKITRANPAIAEMLGYRHDELIGKELIHIGFPGDIGTIQEIFQTLERDGILYYNDAQVQTKTGQVIDSDIYMVDKTNLVQCNIRDISKHKQTAKVLEIERNYLSAVIDNIGEAIVSCNAEGRIVRFNETSRRLHGLPEQAIPADQWAEYYDLYQADGVTPLPMEEIPLFRALQGERVQDAEIVVAPKHSHPFFLVCSGQALTDETGKITGAVVAMHDITERKRMEEAMRRERDLTQRYLYTTQTIMMALDREGRITMINRSGRELLGYTKDEILGCNWFETFLPQPEGMESVYPFFRRIMAGDLSSAEYFENRVVCRDGTQRLIGWHNAFLEDDKGRVTGALSSGEDITERKQAEEALRKSEEKFRHLFEKAEEGILIARGETIEFANPALEDILKYPIDRITSEPFVTFVHPDDRETILDLHLRMMQGQFFEKRYDFRIVASDGTVKWITIYAQVIEWNGAPANLSFVTDITERKQAEEALQESEQRFQTVLENLPGGVFAHDIDGRFLLVNEAACRNTGYSREELLQMHLADIDPAAVERAERLHLQSLEIGQSVSFESTHIRKDGAAYDAEIHLNGINLDGKPAILPIVFDISERKQAEKEQEKLQAQLNQAQKMECVGQLAGGVAHEFNNMLSIINGYAEMSVDMLDPAEPVHENLREIYKAGKRSADIVRQLLTFARKQTIRPVQMDLNDTVSNLLKMLQRLIGENIDLAWHPGHNLWPVKMDSTQLDQIMANLAVNSRDAISNEGKITIETKNVVIDEDYCRQYSYFVPGAYAMLAVSDTGCGMEKEIQDNLFEPFFTTKGVGEGTGLGLATIYGIVKQNNGFINVYSEPGEGTTFKIYFPRHEAQESSASEHLKESVEPTPTGAETILFVEDEAAILQMGRQMLERLGYTVLTAEKPDAALQIAEEHGDTIRLLITDVVMPVMNGSDLAAKLSVRNPDLKTIYMSGYTENAIAHHGVLDEGVQFIQKPFSIRDLAAKVREVVEQE